MGQCMNRMIEVLKNDYKKFRFPCCKRKKTEVKNEPPKRPRKTRSTENIVEGNDESDSENSENSEDEEAEESDE